MSSYTREMYKEEIQKYIKIYGYNSERVGKITLTLCLKHIREIDKIFYSKLMEISTMENGPEFEMSEDEFEKFLNDM